MPETKTTNKPATVHALEVSKKKKERSLKTLTENYGKNSGALKKEIEELTASIIDIKEQELKELKGNG